MKPRLSAQHSSSYPNICNHMKQVINSISQPPVYQPSYEHADTTETTMRKSCTLQMIHASERNRQISKCYIFEVKVVVKFKIHDLIWSCSGQAPHSQRWSECAERWVLTTVSDSSQSSASTPRVTLKVNKNKLVLFVFFYRMCLGCELFMAFAQ